MNKICVIGSLNTDLVAIVSRFPKPGETIDGKEFGTFPGGKGANQAVALGRLGTKVSMVGKLGDDLYGKQYIDTLVKNGVNTAGIGIEQGIASGIAVIEVETSGENRIIIIPGANGTVDIDFIESKQPLILENDIFLLQLEIPIDTVCHTIKLLKKQGKTVILDPAPARKLPDDIFYYIDFLTPNETELEILSGMTIGNTEDMKKAAESLLEKGVGTVVAKVGKRGAYIINKDTFIHSPVFDVKVVDTTAAGDSFNAGFAYGLSLELDLKDCARYANVVASLSTTAKGAQDGMPTLEQVMRIL